MARTESKMMLVRKLSPIQIMEMLGRLEGETLAPKFDEFVGWIMQHGGELLRNDDNFYYDLFLPDVSSLMLFKLTWEGK